MAIPRFKNCCLCFDAKTGAVILGLLGLIAGLFNLTTDSVGLGYYAPEIENMLDEYIEKSMQEFEDKGAPKDEEEQYQELWKKLELIKKTIPWAFVIQIISSALNILVNGSMLYGVQSKKANFMMPWLFMAMLSILITTGFLIIGFVALSVATPGGFLNGFILVVISSPIMALLFYFWNVVRSVYYDIKENKVADPEASRYENPGGKYVKM